jgi:Zn-dependent protease with chaperone function
VTPVAPRAGDIVVMPFIILLLLAVVCWPDNWAKPFWADWWGGNELTFALLTWSGVMLVVASAAWLAGRIRRQLLVEPDGYESLLEYYSGRRFYHFLGLIGFFGFALYLLGWGWTVRSLGSRDAAGQPQMFVGAELLILAPYLVGLVLSWVCFYDAEKALHAAAPASARLTPFWSRSAYVAFHLRHNLSLVFVVVVLMIVEKELRRLPDFQESQVFQVLMGVMFAGIVVCFPWFIRLAMGLKPIPPGPLRDRLQAAARRLHFRCSNLLMWNTHGGVANAFVAGILPQVRYVVLTDRLVNELAPEEVEAVFGHEVGHIKHHHMLFYLAFIVISLVALSGLAAIFIPQLDDFFKNHEDWAPFPLVGVLGTYIFVVFGFLSRRCERQADVFGCRTMSCGRQDCSVHENPEVLLPGGRGLCPTGIRTFIEALEKVALINGISRNRPGLLQSWQHSTIARRVEFLQHILADPALESRFQRRVFLVKWAVVLVLGGLLYVILNT